MKRKRATTEARCLSGTPLTAANLDLWQASQSQSAMPPRLPSPSRSTTSTTTLDAREKLRCYHIHIDTEHPLPESLQRHVDSLTNAQRDSSVAPSPNAKRIVQRRRIASQQNEATGSRHFATYLLPWGEADLDDRVEATPFVTNKAELLLSRYFLPEAPDLQTKHTWKALSQPKPDSCVGYVSRSDASATGVDAAFSCEEESILNDFVLTKALYMPYLTAQWKAPSGAEGLYAAQNQAARDGSVIVNYLYDLYSVAYGSTPSFVETCHFSLVCDMQYVEVWVHWREGIVHYMEQLRCGACRSEKDLLDVRKVIRNINDYAINERLSSIRSALQPFAAANKINPRYAPHPEPILDTTPSLSSRSLRRIALDPPPTPLSVASEPVKKRPRLESESRFSE
jgi:hypothetical protein